MFQPADPEPSMKWDKDLLFVFSPHPIFIFASEAWGRPPVCQFGHPLDARSVRSAVCPMPLEAKKQKHESRLHQPNRPTERHYLR